MENKRSRLLSERDESAPKFLKLAHLYQLFRGKQQYILEMLDIFTEQLPAALLKMEEHIISQDGKGVRYEAHTLKSTIKTIGLKSLVASILRLELSEHDTWDEIEENYNIFKNEALIEVEALNQERDILLKNE